MGCEGVEMPFPVRIGPTELSTVVGVIFRATRPITLKFLALTNRTSATRAVTLHIVPSGGVPTNGNKIADSLSILANDFHPLGASEITIPLYANETLQGFSDASGILLTGAYTDEKKSL